MTISNTKVRTIITIDKEDKKTLEEIAARDDRSFNYIVNKALKQFIEKYDKLPDFMKD